MHTCISSRGLKRSWHSCPRQVNAGNKNTPSTHHPRRRNVTTLMVGLENSHIRKNLTQKVVNPRDIAGEKKSACIHDFCSPQSVPLIQQNWVVTAAIYLICLTDFHCLHIVFVVVLFLCLFQWTSVCACVCVCEQLIKNNKTGANKKDDWCKFDSAHKSSSCSYFTLSLSLSLSLFHTHTHTHMHAHTPVCLSVSACVCYFAKDKLWTGSGTEAKCIETEAK